MIARSSAGWSSVVGRDLPDREIRNNAMNGKTIFASYLNRDQRYRPEDTVLLGPLPVQESAPLVIGIFGEACER